jgi:hypothetical protein
MIRKHCDKQRPTRLTSASHRSNIHTLPGYRIYTWSRLYYTSSTLLNNYNVDFHGIRLCIHQYEHQQVNAVEAAHW